jgi:dTMP kinase
VDSRGKPGVTGRLVVLEGVEGAGKTTQVARLAEWLTESGIPHSVAREPGGTPVGEAIRSVLLDRVELDVPPPTELLLILAARSAFVRKVVRPALERGEVVLADRYEPSTLAYQGYGRGLDLGEIQRLNAFATGGLEADLTVVLDVPVETGLARQAREGKDADRMERGGRAFLERVRTGYRELAARDSRTVLVDARGSSDEVHGVVRKSVEACLRGTLPLRGE